MNRPPAQVELMTIVGLIGTVLIFYPIRRATPKTSA
jgi:hypothetical protein